MFAIISNLTVFYTVVWWYAVFGSSADLKGFLTQSRTLFVWKEMLIVLSCELDEGSCLGTSFQGVFLNWMGSVNSSRKVAPYTFHGSPELIGSSKGTGPCEGGAEVFWVSIAAQASMLLNFGLSFLLQKGLVSSGVLKIDSLTSNNLEIKHLS